MGNICIYSGKYVFTLRYMRKFAPSTSSTMRPTLDNAVNKCLTGSPPTFCHTTQNMRWAFVPNQRVSTVVIITRCSTYVQSVRCPSLSSRSQLQFRKVVRGLSLSHSHTKSTFERPPPFWNHYKRCELLRRLKQSTKQLHWPLRSFWTIICRQCSRRKHMQATHITGARKQGLQNSAQSMRKMCTSYSPLWFSGGLTLSSSRNEEFKIQKTTTNPLTWIVKKAWCWNVGKQERQGDEVHGFSTEMKILGGCHLAPIVTSKSRLTRML